MSSRLNAPMIITGFVDIVLSVILLGLSFRFILKLLAANPETPFVSWLYAVTVPLLSPFSGIFPSPSLENGVIVEFTTLFAILIYILVSYLVVELIKYVSYQSTRYTIVETTTTKS